MKSSLGKAWYIYFTWIFFYEISREISFILWKVATSQFQDVCTEWSSDNLYLVCLRQLALVSGLVASICLGLEGGVRLRWKWMKVDVAAWFVSVDLSSQKVIPYLWATWLPHFQVLLVIFEIRKQTKPPLPGMYLFFFDKTTHPKRPPLKPFTMKNAKHETWVEASCQQSRTRKDMCTWGMMVLLMAEIPNNHLGWCWNPMNNGKNYLPQLVIAGFQPSTVWWLETLLLTMIRLEANVGQEIIERWAIYHWTMEADLFGCLQK